MRISAWSSDVCSSVLEVAVDRFDLAMPADHPLAGEGSLPAGVLAGLPVLLLEAGHCLRDQAIDVCATVGADTGHAIQVTSLPHVCQQVSAGRSDERRGGDACFRCVRTRGSPSY